MLKRRVRLMVLLAAGYTLALGVSCIPNIGNGLQLPGLNLTGN